MQIAQLFFFQLVCAYTANKLAQPRKKIARTRPQRPRVFPSLLDDFDNPDNFADHDDHDDYDDHDGDDDDDYQDDFF